MEGYGGGSLTTGVLATLAASKRARLSDEWATFLERDHELLLVVEMLLIFELIVPRSLLGRGVAPFVLLLAGMPPPPEHAFLPPWFVVESWTPGDV